MPVAPLLSSALYLPNNAVLKKVEADMYYQKTWDQRVLSSAQYFCLYTRHGNRVRNWEEKYKR